MEPITEIIKRIMREHEQKTGTELRLELHMVSDGIWEAEIVELVSGWTGQLGAMSKDPVETLRLVEPELQGFLDYYVGPVD